MIHLVVALKCEAKPLIKKFRLQRAVESRAVPVYKNNEMSLLVSGPGKVNAAAATAFAYASEGMQENSAWLNIGIAGHQQRIPGEGLMINKITDQASQRCWYPPLVFPPRCELENLVTVDKPESAFDTDAVYEMEAAGFYETASRYSTSELVQCFKIVSDNASTTTSVVTEKSVTGLVAAQIEHIEYLVSELMAISDSLEEIQRIPSCYDEICDRWHFTVYQQGQLKRLLKNWYVSYGGPDSLDKDILLHINRCRDGRSVLRELENSPQGLTGQLP